MRSRSHNLPTTLTSFVGRDEDIARVSALLVDQRIVTLTGAGGAGKTRLGLEVAARRLDDHAEGVWFADLASITDAELVPSAVANALGIEEIGLTSVTRTLVDALADRSVLVVLDNCEQVIAATAELVQEVVGHCPGVTVMATSRESLGVHGEAVYRVPSLRTPGGAITSLADLGSQPAMQLFVDRAGLRTDSGLTDADAPGIARICDQLDGIPLAIELAAARVGILRPAQIADALDDRFTLLTGGARTAMPRQRTLEASVDWSYDLLDEDERTTLARLSVFAGSFDLAAAAAVAADGTAAALDLLGALVDKSLVLTTQRPGDTARYRLLQTIRAYAEQKLLDTHDAPTIRDRHLMHFVALAEHAGAELNTPGFRAWSERLDLELDNLRSAMSWAVASRQVEASVRILGSLLRWLVTRAMYTQIRTTLEGTLAASADAEPAVRARALATAAGVTVAAGNWDITAALADECVTQARLAGVDDVLATGLAYRGWATMLSGRDGDHGSDLAEAIEVGRRSGDPSTLCRALRYQGLQSVFTGRVSDAVVSLTESIEVAEMTGDRYSAAVATSFLGGAYLFGGEFERARPYFERGVEGLTAVGSKVFTVTAIGGLALIAAHRGYADEAREHLRHARQVRPDATQHDGSEVSWHTDRFGFHNAIIQALLGNTGPEITAEIEASRTTWRRQPGLLEQVLLALAVNAIGSGDPALGRATIEEGLEHGRSMSTSWSVSQFLHELAALERAEGRAAEATELHHEELAMLARAGNVADAADALEGLAGVMLDRGEPEDAARLFGAGAAIREAAGRQRRGFRAPTVERDLHACRVALGDEDFDAAFGAGGALAPEEAIALARRGRGERDRPTAGWASLTPVELEVVTHVAAGLSNPEVAERLFISRNTVKTHLKRIYGKLAISSRAELAAEATRNARNDA